MRLQRRDLRNTVPCQILIDFGSNYSTTKTDPSSLSSVFQTPNHLALLLAHCLAGQAQHLSNFLRQNHHGSIAAQTRRGGIGL
jgi:hypothetical protein